MFVIEGTATERPRSSSSGEERRTPDTLDNRRRGTVGARKKPKKAAGRVARATRMQRAFSSSHSTGLELASASEDAEERTARGYQSLSCDKDARLHPHREGEKRRAILSRREERRGRNEWGIESDVRAARKDIIAVRGNDVLLKEEEEYTSSKRRDFDEKNRAEDHQGRERRWEGRGNQHGRRTFEKDEESARDAGC